MSGLMTLSGPKVPSKTSKTCFCCRWRFRYLRNLSTTIYRNAPYQPRSHPTHGQETDGHRHGTPDLRASLERRWKPMRGEATVLREDGSQARISKDRGVSSLIGASNGRTTFIQPQNVQQCQKRCYRSSQILDQIVTPVSAEAAHPPPARVDPITIESDKLRGIRAQLRHWQELHGHEDSLHKMTDFDSDLSTSGTIQNNMSRLPSDKTLLQPTEMDEEDQHEAMACFMPSNSDEPESNPDGAARYLSMGDLVEVEYPISEKESLVAVFVRRIGRLAQLFTMQGRWTHVDEKRVLYSIPGWIGSEMVHPLQPYLPSPETVEQHWEELLDDALVHDLSVPRHIAAPLVTRLVNFYEESQTIYRKHAEALEGAHDLLAHEEDLRYGSLVAVASSLLQTPTDKLPVTALYTVRRALARAGVAFGFDSRSHRLTGYLQIRSKSYVRMIKQVQQWIREWQEDLAQQATMTKRQLERRRVKPGAQIVHTFLEKARTVVRKNREHRQPTPSGNVGPSDIKLPITREQDSIRIRRTFNFSGSEIELVKFMEAWCLSRMFMGQSSVESLPRLLLHSMGLYDDYNLDHATGLMFLQELGTILPYENRVRYDAHLLLPTSQHSRPLQELLKRCLQIREEHGFSDSMRDLRHDWGSLPVYCIDKASAHEIDDGISIEPVASRDGSGGQEWWLRVHIANPTAFFNRDHPLARMARHMAESMYMPEHTYTMLPRWATQGHFSLDKNRPCLTISAKVDDAGRILAKDVRPGLIRNVLRLPNEDVNRLLDEHFEEPVQETVLTVGGAPPPVNERTGSFARATEAGVEQLRTLRRLAKHRRGIRMAAGGLFFDAQRPEVAVWQNFTAPGLAWDHPFRKGGRTVEGDPVIQMRTRGLMNWFASLEAPASLLVREMMLLACEVASQWCKERHIPGVFRSLVPSPSGPSSESFFRDVLAPAAANSPNGEYPMHLGIKYLKTFGASQIVTRPMKHRILGLNSYGKVTSPLRRYGDMIIHWQIEAALRQEASTGRSLITDDPNADRNFLPFSDAVLKTIIVGLQPREHAIRRAEIHSDNFWNSMLFFRAIHFKETQLPFERWHAYCNSSSDLFNRNGMGVICVETNTAGYMSNPDTHGLPSPRLGDTWECEINYVDVYKRVLMMKPVKLVERVEE